MTFIQLERQFIPWGDKDPAQVEASMLTGRYSGSVSWNDLLAKRRVVVLAEAGSGKSDELIAQAAALRDTGRYSFYATVQNVAHEGLPTAMQAADRAVLEDWMASDDEAWFFIDSVDEAKLDNIRLDAALRRLADGLGGAAARARICLSGRYTDWEFRADLARFNAVLPVPNTGPVIAPEPPKELLVKFLSHELTRRQKVETEQPFVVLMTPLDAARIRTFAAANGIGQLDEFMIAIEEANLWSLAARPLDLIWLVDYWRRNSRFGRFGEMLETSLVERLKETNPVHLRRDPIAPALAMKALERIGAAFDFGRTDKIAIPDSQFAMRSSESGLDLALILPDWSAEHRQRLLTRPVFDPATFGCVRLHNDNQGVVRSYLAARWLRQRRLANCSIKALNDLLFAEMYGVAVVRPSMSQTVAWLAIWDDDVAREVIKRAPQLLLSGGDPASLPLATREAALTRVVEQTAVNGDGFRLYERESVKRLATADMAPVIQTLWAKYKRNEEVARLLLLMIDLGRLTACVDVATEAAFGTFFDRYTPIYAGRALLATADGALLRRYADMIKLEAPKLPGQMLWDAFERLFPQYISLDDVLALLGAMEPAQRDASYGMQIFGPRLSDALSSRSDLERLLRGLLVLMGDRPSPPNYEQTDAEKAYEPAVVAAAQKILSLVAANEAPPVTIDAALRLAEDRLYRQSGKSSALQTDLHVSAERRRLAFWRASEVFDGNPLLREMKITTVTHMDVLGWSAGLTIEDLDWLLADALIRETDDERLLAIDGAFRVWSENGRTDEVLDRIRSAANANEVTRNQLAGWLTPRVLSEQEVNFNREHEEMRRQHEAERTARDESWMTFIDGLKTNPQQLANLPTPTAESIDGRLFALWQLFNASSAESSRYAIDDTSAIEPLLGVELTAALQDAMISFWRQWRPALESERDADKRNVINMVDCMGIAGVSLDAKDNPGWVSGLTSELAVRAAQYATLELNGFPAWFPALAIAWPQEAGGVLMNEVRAQLDTAQPGPIHGILHDLIYGAVELAALVAPYLLDELRSRPGMHFHVLSPVLDVLARGLANQAEQPQLGTLALDRFKTSADLDEQAAYLGAAFGADPEAATSALTNKLDSLDRGAQTALAKRVLPRVFGNHIFGRNNVPPKLPFAVLERLVHVAFRTIRPDEDNQRPSGIAYSPDERDAAEASRSSAFNQLADTPGFATYAALQRLATAPDFPIEREYLHRLAQIRAEQDSERAPWQPGEAFELESAFDFAPQTPADLQSIALGRIADMQHDLHHADYSQGGTVKSLPNEREVQKWIAAEFKSRQGRAYSLEREPHVADEKEPDIRLQARATSASLPIEVKVAESWSLTQLEEALNDQLGAKYLRARDAAHGVLLLVHQAARPQGWKDVDGAILSFDEVAAYLTKMANETASTAHDAPQAKIAVIDVSDVAAPSPPKAKPRRSRAKRAKQK